MKHNPSFKNVALSALLLTAIAVPAVASANDGSHTQANAKLTSVAGQAVQALNAPSAALIKTDPLELAKKYAPETVSDWKNTLDQYKKVTGYSIEGRAPIVTRSSEEKTTDGTVPALTISQESISLDKFKTYDLKSASVVAAVPAKEATLDKVTSRIEASQRTNVAELKEGTGPAENRLEAVQAVATQASGEFAAFIQAEIELAKAADSEDAGAIRASLAQSLKQYKQQITALQNATGDSLPAEVVKTETATEIGSLPQTVTNPSGK
ncbi:hypothetical protein WMW72_04700 [Paenibacillus filicis]|uniref:Uncharacterized protein n=1 Tax=Paenibacillus filicis TaxID=669464 RepID=A0ABU9DEA8_9BACL